jgi:hypothetical protein
VVSPDKPPPTSVKANWACFAAMNGLPHLINPGTILASPASLRHQLPCVTSFLVEQARLSNISETGFNHGDLHWNAGKSEVFYGEIFRNIPFCWEGEKLFVLVDTTSATSMVYDISKSTRHIRRR